MGRKPKLDHVLCHFVDDSDSQMSVVTFYKNHFRYNSWEEGEVSKWKIVNGIFYCIHLGARDWATDNNTGLATDNSDQDKLFIDQIEAAIAIEKMLK